VRSLAARTSLVVACAASAVLFGSTAAEGAPDPRTESRAAFLRGVSEAHKEHFTAARDAFLEAYALFPHPSILMNLGVARLHTGEYVAAEQNLGRFLVDDGGASAEDLANAQAALNVVRKHLGTLHVRVSPDAARARLDGVPLPLVPGTFTDVRAVVGPAELRVEADGYEPLVRPLVVSHEDNAPIDLRLVPSDERDPGGAHHAGGAHDVGARPLALGLSLAGGAVVAAAVGTVAGFEAIGDAHDYNTPGSSQFQSHSVRSEGIAWRTSADALFASALILGGAATYLLVVPLHGRASASIGPTSARVVLRF
jgi:hypothetical protein